MATDQTSRFNPSQNKFVALVVDHDPVSRLDLCNLIESEGGQAIEAKNRTGALMALVERRPNIVLLDTTISQTGGLDTCKQIQAFSHGPDTPVLAILASEDEESINLALAVGAADYVTKPIRPAVLRQRMRRLLRVHGTEAAILRAKKEWETAIDAVSDMVILTDLDGKIIRCNLAAIQRLETTYLQLISHDLRQILLKDSEQELMLPFGQPREMQFPTLPGWFEACKFSAQVEGQQQTIVYVLKDITKRKQLEENVQQSEQRFRALVENISEGVELFDAEGKVLYASPMVADILGVPEGTELTRLNPMDSLHPEDREQYFSHFLQLLQQPGNRFTFEMRMQRIDGSWIWAEASVRNMLMEPGMNAILMNFRDVTQRKQLEEALRQSEQRFKALVENISEGIQLIDADGKTVYASPTAMRMTGYTEEYIGSSPFDYLHPDDLPHWSELFNRLLQQPDMVLTTELRTRHKSGRWIWLEVTGCNLLTAAGLESILVHFKDITERKHNETTLRQLSQAVEQSPVSVVITDSAGHIEYVNPRFTQLTGYRFQEVRGQNPRLLKSGQTPSETFIHLWDTIRSGRVWSGEFINRKKNGEHFIERASVSPVVDERGVITHFLALKEDITEHKQLEESLRQSEKRFRAMIENSADAIALVDVRGKITYATPAITGISGYKPEDYVGHKVSEFIHPEDMPELVDGFTELARVPGSISTSSFRSQHIDGSWRWVDVTTSNQLADPAVKAIIANFRDVTEGKRSEEMLKQTEERLRLIVETVPIPILISTAADGQVLFANTALGEMFGLSVQELLGRHTPDFYFDPSQRQSMMEVLYREGKLHNYELAIKKQDQTPLWVLVSMQPLTYEDQPALLAALYDVTERKQAEAALAESEQRFRQFFAASPDAVLVIDPSDPVDWRIVDCNEAACQMNGYMREEIIGQPVDLLNTTVGTALERADYLARLRSAGVMHLEVLHRRKDGTVFPVEISTTIFTVNGHELILGIDRDVTRRKQAEQDLRLSEERFQLVTYATNDAVWDLNLSTGKRWWNRGVRLLFGYTADQVSPDQTWWGTRIHPDDRAKVVTGFQAALESDGQFWSKEYRFLRADGTYAYVFDRGYIMQDNQGTPARVIGAMMDLTERKQSEEALRRREQQLEEAQRIAHLGNWEWDPHANVAVWSKEMCQLYELEQGSTPPDLETFLSRIHPDDLDVIMPIVQQSIPNVQPCEYDYRIILAGGEERWLHGTTEFLKDETGQPIKLRGTAQDVTERKRAEEALRASQAELSEALRIARLAYWEYDFPHDMFIFNDHFYSILHTTASQEGGYRMASAHYAQKFCHPDDKTVVETEIQKMLNSTDRSYRNQLDHRILYIDGGIGYISVRINLERNEQDQSLRCYGTIQDISERKRMEEALRKSEELFSKAFHASPAPMGITRVDNGLIIDVNGSWERLFGYDRQAVLGRRITELNTYRNPQDRTTIIQQIYEQGKVIDYEVKVQTESEEERVVLMSAQIVEIQGQACLMSTFYDITEKSRIYETMLASQKLADLGTLAAGVAHEMNSPLQVITGLSQSLLKRLAKDGVAAEQLQHNLDIIQRNGWRCAAIVRSLHTYARNSGVSMQPTDLNALVSDGLLLIEHQLKSWANISVQTALAADLPSLTCDRNQITQVLINLLTNARDAMPNGGAITITTSHDPKPDQLILQIGDTGTGIPDSIRSKIFDPFFTTKPLGKGTGLGLSIVAGIVRAHGGTVDVNDALPVGTTFLLRFPTRPRKLPDPETGTTPGRFDNIIGTASSTADPISLVKEFSHDQNTSC